MAGLARTKRLPHALILIGLWFFAAAFPCERASAETLRDVTCKGCLLLTNGPAEEPLPLVIVLHGDEGQPRKVAELWAGVAERGLCGAGLCTKSETPDQRARVFLPFCPRGEGCTGSYWRWGQSPTWFFSRIDELSARYAIAPNRIYFAGWSGGATYLGIFAEALSTRAAGLSLAGGGAPSPEPCSANPCIGVDYLMGNANPLIELARSTRDRLEACGHAVNWNELAKADHAAEWRAYQREVPAIASRLLALSRAGCEPEPGAPAPAPAAPTAHPAPSALVSSGAPPLLASGEPILPKVPVETQSCTCEVTHGRTKGSALVVLAAIALCTVRRRMTRAKSPRQRACGRLGPGTSHSC